MASTKVGAETEIMVPIHGIKVSVFSMINFKKIGHSKISVNFHWKIGTICWHLCRAVNLGMLSPKLGTANSLESSNLSSMIQSGKSHWAE
jgi:hypothetical protein